MKIKVFVTIMTLAILSGCVGSVNPLFTEKDLIFDAALLGDWKYEKENWLFEKEADNKYKLTHSDNGTLAVFKAYLVKINNLTFLDISPLDINSKNYFYEMHSLPVHTFWKIEIEKEQIVIKMLDPDLLEKAIDQNKVDIAFVESQDCRILLTASTSKLQNFIQSNLELFGEPSILKRNN